MVTLHHGDCLDVLKTLPDNSVDSIVTDPPYGLSFMGKRWDYDVPSIEVWQECLRVLKPGGYLLAFAGTRTQHRMACRVEDAGFEIRDCIMWLYGSGFPKSHDVSKAIDREAGAEREVVRTVKKTPSAASDNLHEGWKRPWAEDHPKTMNITAPATDAAKQWEGWGTALKPAYEPCILARKPLEGTVAQNVQQWGVGGLNVDGCRVMHGDTLPKMSGKAVLGGSGDGWDRPWKNSDDGIARRQAAADAAIEKANNLGRWPANIIHDGSPEVVELFPVTGPSKAAHRGNLDDIRGNNFCAKHGTRIEGTNTLRGHNDNGGSASRFFYCAKASRADRDEGLEGMPKRGRNEVYGNGLNTATKCDPAMGHTPDSVEARPQVRNHHPTVKPTDLMRYLCRLITPPNGVILDPFMGSGSTGKAAILEGFGFIGIEREAEYVRIASARIEHAHNQHIAKRPSLSEISDLGCRDDVYKTSLTINVL